MGARKLSDHVHKSSQKELDPRAFIDAWYKKAEIASWVKNVKDGFRAAIADELGVEESSVSDKQVYQCMHALNRSGHLDSALRDLGLVPKPSVFSAIIGWHDIEHLRARGLSNWIAGLTSIGAKMAILAILALKGIDYVSR